MDWDNSSDIKYTLEREYKMSTNFKLEEISGKDHENCTVSGLMFAFQYPFLTKTTIFSKFKNDYTIHSAVEFEDAKGQGRLQNFFFGWACTVIYSVVCVFLESDFHT